MFQKFLGGKTAVVTGSNSGIGLGIAHRLAMAGADIVLNSFTDREEDHALAESLARDHCGTVRYIKADMSKGDECRALIERAGRCDILVNNAGIQHVAAIPDFPVEKWDAIIAINLTSAFHTTAAALPMMRAAGWGRIVNVASAHGLTASAFKSAYVAAKHGIVGFTKVTALETAKEAITCNALCPGTTDTPSLTDRMQAQPDPEAARRAFVARQPMGRLGLAEEMAEAAVYLASDLSAFATGTVLTVDGGQTL